MRESFEDSVRKDFEEGTYRYQNSRLEALPEEELLILEEWISVLKQKDEKQAIDILAETFHVTAALCNGFRPSEYIDSMLNSEIGQLHKLQIDPDDILMSTARIHGAQGFLEFNTQLRNWLISDERSPEFMDGLANDSEYAFWVGCFLRDCDWENAKECFRIAIEGSLNKRMRIRALQNTAWTCVHLGALDDAISSYDEIVELAEIEDTRKLASECRGYIRALRDYGIHDPETEPMFAPGAAEFAEYGVLKQAKEVLESLKSEGGIANSSAVPSHLQKWIDEETGVDRGIRQRLSQQLGTEVDELPAEVADELADAERLRLLARSPGQAISNLYQAAANCLHWYVGTRFIPYARERAERFPVGIKSLSIYQWAGLFCSLDRRDDKPVTEPIVRLLIVPFRSFVADNLSRDNKSALLSIGEKLRRIQAMRNPYGHKEGGIAGGPPSRTQQMQHLEELHRLVIGQRDSESVINQIIRLGISKKI